MKVLVENYVGRALLYAIIAGVVVFCYSLGILLWLGMGLLAPLFSVLLGLVAFGAVVGMFLIYPSQVCSSKKKSIEANLPFAASHMAAIAVSGVSTHIAFKLIAGVKEYGEIARASAQIVRNVEVFGMDITSAIKQVAARTPSQEFRHFLNGMVSTLSTGGDLRKYLQSAAREALADYRLRRERYLGTLGLYADFYVGVLIAAPLFFISILSLMAIIGGEIAGLSIPFIMSIGIYLLIPLLNIFFILFIHFTQPAV
jgi:flagellar protein FlaJ